MNKPKWFCLKLLFVLCLGVISGCYKPLIIPENREMVVSTENMLQFHCQLFDEHKKPGIAGFLFSKLFSIAHPFAFKAASCASMNARRKPIGFEIPGMGACGLPAPEMIRVP